jgi:hypothetical protein
VTQVAYRPALLFIDSYAYLGNLHALYPTHIQPIGYDIFLRPFLWLGSLATVAALQHLIGLGMGIAIYAVLVRLGAHRWVAALAAGPCCSTRSSCRSSRTSCPRSLRGPRARDPRALALEVALPASPHPAVPAPIPDVCAGDVVRRRAFGVRVMARL